MHHVMLQQGRKMSLPHYGGGIMPGQELGIVYGSQ